MTWTINKCLRIQTSATPNPNLNLFNLLVTLRCDFQVLPEMEGFQIYSTFKAFTTVWGTEVSTDGLMLCSESWCCFIRGNFVLPQDSQGSRWLACTVPISINTEAPCQRPYSSCNSELEHRELLWPVWQLELLMLSTGTISWNLMKLKKINNFLRI